MVERYLAKVQVASSNLVSRSKYISPCSVRGFLFLVQQFSASVAPLVSRSKYTKPLLCQGFFVFGTAVLSERRTADFTLQIHKPLLCQGFFLVQQFSASVAPLISRSKYTKPLLCQGFFFGTAVLSERRTADFPLQIHKAPALSGVFCFWYGSSQRASHRWFPAPNTLSPCSVRGFLFLVQQFSASVAPLISRSKYTKPLLCQGFFFGTAVLSERRTADFTLQIHLAPALSGVFCFWYSSSQRASHRWFPAPNTLSPCSVRVFCFWYSRSQQASHRCWADLETKVH